MLEYILTNKVELIELFLAVLGAASIIAKLTPTEADNKAIAAVLKVVHTFGLTKE